MTKIIASLIVASSLLAGIGSASAAPGSAVQDAARLGFITVGGAFDAR
jgi:hypothetical protein